MEKVNTCVEKIKDAFKELLRASGSEAEMIGNVAFVSNRLSEALEEAIYEIDEEKT